MTDFDPFDRRLAEAFGRYAADRPTLDDPLQFARAIARDHPRTSAWSSVIARRSTRRLVLIAVGALLMLATVYALAGSGAFRRPIGPSGAQPDELFGDFQATVTAPRPPVPAGIYTLDVNSPSLLRSPSGEALTWAGRAGATVPTLAGGLDLAIRADGSCGDARYAVVVGDGVRDPSPGPSASPAGSDPTAGSSQSVLQAVGAGEPFRLLPIADECADRVAILTSGPWAHRTAALVAGNRYRSISFTEPFDFVMPVADPNVPPAVARFWGKGVFKIGNGYSWTSFFVDDVPVAANVCDPSGGLFADVPATPSAVGAWLRGGRGITVTAERDLAVDGRAAKSFEIHGDGCGTWTAPLDPGEFYYGFRVYAIPTGDDTILYLPWSDGGSSLAIETAADELVRSMTFDRGG